MGTNIEVKIAQMSTTIENLDNKADETLSLLRQLNGTVREHGEKLATIEQWRTSHTKETHGTVREHGEKLATIEQWRTSHAKETHGTINGEIKNLRQRDTISGALSTLIGSVVGIIASLRTQ